MVFASSMAFTSNMNLHDMLSSGIVFAFSNFIKQVPCFTRDLYNERVLCVIRVVFIIFWIASHSFFASRVSLLQTMCFHQTFFSASNKFFATHSYCIMCCSTWQTVVTSSIINSLSSFFASKSFLLRTHSLHLKLPLTNMSVAVLAPHNFFP